jgi:hypothetical protein
LLFPPSQAAARPQNQTQGGRLEKEKQTLKGFSREKTNLEKKSLIAGLYHDGTVKFSFYFKEYLSAKHNKNIIYQAEETSPDMITASLDRTGTAAFLEIY